MDSVLDLSGSRIELEASLEMADSAALGRLRRALENVIRERRQRLVAQALLEDAPQITRQFRNLEGCE